MCVVGYALTVIKAIIVVVPRAVNYLSHSSQLSILFSYLLFFELLS